MKLLVEIDVDEINMAIRSITVNGQVAPHIKPAGEEWWYSLHKQDHREHCIEAGVPDAAPLTWEIQLVEQSY